MTINSEANSDPLHDSQQLISTRICSLAIFPLPRLINTLRSGRDSSLFHPIRLAICKYYSNDNIPLRLRLRGNCSNRAS